MIGGWMQSWAWLAGNTDFRWDQRLLSADVMVNLMCHLGWAAVPSYSIIHPSKCCCEGVFLDAINISPVDSEESNLFRTVGGLNPDWGSPKQHNSASGRQHWNPTGVSACRVWTRPWNVNPRLCFQLAIHNSDLTGPTTAEANSLTYNKSLSLPPPLAPKERQMLYKYYWIREWRKARVRVCMWLHVSLSLSPSPIHTHSFIHLIIFIEHLSPRERKRTLLLVLFRWIAPIHWERVLLRSIPCPSA